LDPAILSNKLDSETEFLYNEISDIVLFVKPVPEILSSFKLILILSFVISETFPAPISNCSATKSVAPFTTSMSASGTFEIVAEGTTTSILSHNKEEGVISVTIIPPAFSMILKLFEVSKDKVTSVPLIILPNVSALIVNVVVHCGNVIPKLLQVNIKEVSNKVQVANKS
jgi:hypothetical protein